MPTPHAISCLQSYFFSKAEKKRLQRILTQRSENKLPKLRPKLPKYRYLTLKIQQDGVNVVLMLVDARCR